ncbi:hypothetical protein ACI2K4_20450 [Micromonospora sp. NPDC050397]|uniref:hypothetical protein n=1 Tax=Micromonospora sp. NPDC050397 TaxID=3364279 RepID=UPI00384EA0CA
MYDVVLLTLGSGRDSSAGCGGGDGCCGSAAEGAGESCNDTPRVPVLTCADALTARGARVETVTAHSDAEIDEVLSRFDAPARPDGLTWPEQDSKTRLVVATASDGQLRAVIRRMVRRYAPPPSRRPADLAGNRTVPDLPPIALLPLDPAGRGRGGDPAPTDLVGQLGLPRDPAEVAAALLDGPVRRLDLLRNDGSSVTLDGVLLAHADDNGRTLPWRGRVEVDDTILTSGDDPVLACAIGNGRGYAQLAGLPLLTEADPDNGVIEVAVAVPVLAGPRWGRKKVRIEVRRARGRAVAVVPRDGNLPYVDDGVSGELGRKRSWWIEPGAWAVYGR